MGKKQKQNHKSKEELLAELRNNKDFQEKIKFTKEVFYPALCKATKNVDDASMFLGSMTTVMMSSFLEFMKEKKFSELDLASKLDTTSDRYIEMKELLAVFADMNVFDVKSHFENMKAEVHLWVNEENKNKTLEQLPKKWIDEI